LQANLAASQSTNPDTDSLWRQFDDNPIRITKPEPEMLVANAELRERELLNLHWQDVRLERDKLRVRR
jgi:hypothetical protein